MNIKIIAVGKLKEDYLNLGINEYLKRLKTTINIQIIEIKESTRKSKEENLAEEAKLILNQIKTNDYVVSLAIEGINHTSNALASIISEQTNNAKVLCFIIGSSEGLSPLVKERSNLLLSFGLLTHPHQLMRLILIEQIYRSYTIIKGMKYHK